MGGVVLQRKRPMAALLHYCQALSDRGTVAGRATMWQGCQGWFTEAEERARFSPTPGVSLGLIGDGTNGLGSSRSEPGKGVCVH